MKKTLTLLTVALAALALTARPAAALGDKEAAILGGVIGGVILGAAIDDALDGDADVSFDLAYTTTNYGHRDRGHGDRHDRDRGDRWDRRDRGHDRGDRHYDRGDRHDRGRGYWTYRTVKVWIPKRTWFTYDRWGNRTKHFERGHWSYQREKVWVPTRRGW
ncbi:hypothetical protein [Actomonas aquatica]|uniref:Glycine zipper domain-containing protein n=1 Tax=Actomonas aquatica TaxID=2866162 RepID=A0ABZ1C638_9BACT|nr:hypothetical protein [Opitutus sp. WL0086]WRQ87064.1 hypothetical protein K1X11_019795 [Opitutus sp. WL0086]